MASLVSIASVILLAWTCSCDEAHTLKECDNTIALFRSSLWIEKVQAIAKWEGTNCGMALDVSLGGPEASIMEYNQRKSPDYLCAGVLISERHVLTAAHCFDPRPQNPRLYSVQLESESTESGVEYNVYDVDVHPDYLPGSSYYDLAVMTLRANVANDTMPICLPTRTDAFDKRLSYVLEWSPKYYGNKSPMALRARRALVANNADCSEFFSNVRMRELPRGIIAGQMCTDIQEIQGGCDRYMGSPMIVPDRSYRWSAVGVATFGEKCGDHNFPGVYTKVTHYLPWIQRIMKSA